MMWAVTEPFDAALLPPPLGQLWADTKDRPVLSPTIDAFELWLEENDQRPPAVLVALAYLMFREASLVKDVAECAHRALALIAESKIRTDEVLELRRRIDEAVASEMIEEACLLHMRQRPLESLSRRELRDLAAWLGSSKDPEDCGLAARYWLALASRETEDRDVRHCLTGAACAFAAAGDWAEAMPRLESIVASPDYGGWMRDFSWYRLLDKAVAEDDVETFRERWDAALAVEREDPFPFSHPPQDAYLAFAVRHGLGEVARHVAEIVISRRSPRAQKSLAGLIDQARRLP